MELVLTSIDRLDRMKHVARRVEGLGYGSCVDKGACTSTDNHVVVGACADKVFWLTRFRDALLVRMASVLTMWVGV